MRIRSSQLDPTSLSYLQEIERTRGAGANGVFAPRMYQATNPRAGWLALSLLALVCLGIAASLCRPSVVEGARFPTLANWQAGLTGLGVLLLLTGAGRRLRKLPPPAFRSAFLYADALHLWDVNADHVTVTDLRQMEDVDGYHNTVGGNYVSSRVVLKFLGRSGTQELFLYRRDVAEEMVRFLSGLAVLRRSSDEGTRVLMQTSPALLGAVARRLSNGSDGDLNNLSIGPDLPEPSEVRRPATSVAGGSRRRALLPWLAGAVAAALGVFGFPLLDNYLLDEHLFAQVPAKDTGSFEPLDRYLERFPAGRHAAEVRDLRDDRRYALALREAEGKHSPSHLRRYLADAGNTRHRAEAQVRINRFYDEVIARLKERARVHGAKMDRQMFDAVLALLEALKKTHRPVVTIGFKASQDPLPKTSGQKLLEKWVHDRRVKEYAELAALARRSKDHTAILPLGDVFKPEQTARREQVILVRLRAALQKALGADILTLEPAAPGQEPMIEVAYHTFAAGGLYVYTQTLTTHRRYAAPLVTKTVKGLLRGYEVKWTITIRPPQTKQPFVCRFPSAPANDLNYDSRPSDPDWAPYAIILYSGFFDMSSRLIRNFALDPGPAPKSIPFGTVAAKAL